MNDAAAADAGNDLIREQAPGLWRALSALGRRVRQPPDFLPQQSAEARGKTFNATIGQITDGHGRAVGAGDLGGRHFRELAGRHPDLVPFRIEGTAKLGFPGACLGFLTLPFAAGAPLAIELEKKLKMLLRAAVGSPPALTQVLLLAAWTPP